MIQVTDLFTKEQVMVDESQKKIIDFSNKEQKIYYSAPEADSEEEHWVIYIEAGTVDKVEDKLITYNNVVRTVYATAMKFAASKNDPDHKIWDKCVEYAKAHQEELFNDAGDWKDNLTVGPSLEEVLDN